MNHPARGAGGSIKPGASAPGSREQMWRARGVGDSRLMRTVPMFNLVRHSRRNGPHEICRPLRGLGNSDALIPGARAPGFTLSRAPRAFRHLPPSWVSQLCNCIPKGDGVKLHHYHCPRKGIACLLLPERVKIRLPGQSFVPVGKWQGMKRFLLRRLRAISSSAVVAAILLCAFAVGLVPFESVSASSNCALPCCKGKAPHAAGGCMDGSCHINLFNRQRSIHAHHSTSSVQTEKLCGLPLKSVSRRIVKSRVQPIRDNVPVGASLATSTTTRRAMDCAGCVSAFSNSMRRDAAAMRFADRLRPQADNQLRSFARHPAQPLYCLFERCSPRGPPLFSS